MIVCRVRGVVLVVIVLVSVSLLEIGYLGGWFFSLAVGALGCAHQVECLFGAGQRDVFEILFLLSLPVLLVLAWLGEEGIAHHKDAVGFKPLGLVGARDSDPEPWVWVGDGLNKFWE